jgi:hypothetical protein
MPLGDELFDIIACEFQRFGQFFYPSYTFNCSTNLSIRSISAGMLMRWVHLGVHCPQAVQWFACRSFGTLRS